PLHDLELHRQLADLRLDALELALRRRTVAPLEAVRPDFLRDGDPTSRYRFVKAEKDRYPVTQLCRMAQVSRAAYYSVWTASRAQGRSRQLRWSARVPVSGVMNRVQRPDGKSGRTGLNQWSASQTAIIARLSVRWSNQFSHRSIVAPPRWAMPLADSL